MILKTKTAFFCVECGYESGKWLGRCPGCSAWNSFSEEPVQHGKKKDKQPAASLINIKDVAAMDDIRLSSGIGEMDKVLGGGLVRGSLILLGGDPGIGKSTLSMQMAMVMSRSGRKMLYVSGEESPQQIKLRAARLGDCGAVFSLLAATDIDDIIVSAEKLMPELLVIDSIQTMYDAALAAAPGSVSQVRECAGKLLRFAKERNVATMIVGHITKEGQIAGPKILEHMVDAVLYFEGERNHDFRLLRAQKNRFGGINECGIFSMTGAGLEEVRNPSALLLADRGEGHPGTVVTVCMEGNRPVLLEVQALACQSYYGMPRRLVSGYDYNRLVMLLAVLEKRCNLPMGQQDVFVNVIGGMKISETAADLAIVTAIISSFRNVPLKQKAAAFGEISLTGGVRMVMNAAERIAEAAALGYETIYLPRGCKTGKKKTATELVAVEDIHAVLEIISGC